MNRQEKAPGQYVCHSCGNPLPASARQTDACTNCGHTEWVTALK